MSNCIEMLTEIGVSVVAITFDGASSNLSMAQCLGADISNVNLKTSFSHPS